MLRCGVRPAAATLILLAAAAPHPAGHHAGLPAVHRPAPAPSRQQLQLRQSEAQARAANTLASLAAARRQAAEAAARALALSSASVQAAARVQATERIAGETTDRIDALVAQRQAAQAALKADADALAPLLPVIERLSLYPAETLLAAPASPDDALSGLMVLRGLSRTLEARARDLRDQQARLDTLAARLRGERQQLSATQQRQAAQQAEVAARAQAAQALQAASRQAADNAAREQAAAAAQATSLGEAIARIASAERAADQAARDRVRRDEAAAARRHAPAKGVTREAVEPADIPAGPGLTQGGAAPVAGRLLQSFGAQTDAGPAAGLTYATPSLATVTAPCAGRIDFAGPFRSYGRMLILNCGHDDRFVLAGLDRLDVAIGQRLARGAAVGRMAAVDGAGSAGRPSLYVQLRHGDATIDPSRFLQAPR